MAGAKRSRATGLIELCCGWLVICHHRFALGLLDAREGTRFGGAAVPRGELGARARPPPTYSRRGGGAGAAASDPAAPAGSVGAVRPMRPEPNLAEAGK